ncbi:hypothetical protein OFL57_31170, partial [Pseudomonas aeruginosa]|nr:hypothetical protein [Pseudomonas aeruginosa]
GAEFTGIYFHGDRLSNMPYLFARLIPYASLVLGTKPGEASVFVYTPEDKKVHRRAVRFTPVQEGDSARVLAGLKPGETVVAAGGGWLTDGQPVTPLEATTQLTKR